MDGDVIRGAVQRLFSTTTTGIREAEQYIKSIEGNAGYTVGLLQFIGTVLNGINAGDPQQAALCQQAAVLFKNTVSKRWEESDDGGEVAPVIPDVDKRMIKQIIIPLICRYCTP
jgi:hypothetical protein